MLKSEWPQLVLLAVPFLVLVPLWDKFPPRVAIHWGLNGKPNGWADKEWGLFLLPVTNVGLALLFAFIHQFDSRLRGYGSETRASLKRVTKTLGLATGIFMTSMALLIDAVALGWKLDVLRVVTLGMLALFAVMGNYLPKLRPNRFVGIRTPWTLKSPEVWMRTHRLFGRIFLIGSLALMPPCVLLPSTWAVLLFTGFILLVSFGSMIYSYVCYRSPAPS
ncbi:MAG TPA: SdpI family protein [Candidatus Methylacidiphilales bacterium]|nr:SdpI family protein [Candidatus Methylacidiphilales bacterium]